MLYDFLKIFHILSATLLLTGIALSVIAWKKSNDIAALFQNIQVKTFALIIPFAVLQLVTGFTIISLEEYDLSEIWIIGSISAFIIVIISWFAFLFFLSSSFHRRWQAAMLGVCVLSLFSMIFFMANRI